MSISPATTAPKSGDAENLGLKAEFVSLFMHLLMLWSVVAAMSRVDSSDRWTVLGPLATVGLLLGFGLAKIRVQDLMAHSIAVWFGALSSLFLVGSQATSLGEVAANRGRAYRDLVQGVSESLLGNQVGPVDDRQLLAVLGLTSWLLAYSSAWVVYRRRWYTAGIGVPAAILLTSLRIDDQNGGWPLALFLIGAIGLGARDSFVGNVRRWSLRRMPASTGLAPRFMLAGIPVAVVSVILAILVAPVIKDAMKPSYRDWAESLWSDMSEVIPESLLNGSDPGSSYTDFDDEWVVDEGGELSTAVVADVSSDRPFYLALKRQDYYTGKGFRSNVAATFSSTADSPSDVTHVTFMNGGPVGLSSDVTGGREPVSATVRIVLPPGDLMFTIASYRNSSESVRTIMGWIELEQFLVDVDSIDVADVPIDLQGLIDTIKGQDYTANGNGASVAFTDPDVADAFDAQRARLSAYPVAVTLSVGTDGHLMAQFDGHIPNYDDLETVYFEEDVAAGVEYTVEGIDTVANADQLRDTGSDYPSWVTERFLQQSATVTNRTRELAANIVAEAGASDPYSKAVAIEDYLRATFPYEISSPLPDDNQDLVDFFLFEHKAGRCIHYASSMVVMLRAVGVPTRMVTGFSASNEINSSGEYVYRGNQAHTWPEVFFPGFGWIPFEPTANLPESEYDSVVQPDEQLDASPVPEPTVDASPEPTADSSPQAEATPIPPQLSVNVGADDGNPIVRFAVYLLLIGTVLLLGVGGFLTLTWRRGLGGLPPAAGLYARMLKVGRWAGVEPTLSSTPGEYGRTLTRVLPGSAGHVRSITEAYYQERFDPSARGNVSLAKANEGWTHLRRNLLRWRIRKPKSP